MVYGFDSAGKFVKKFDLVEVQRCQYLSTSVRNAGTRWNFWKKAPAKISTSAKNVGAWIRKNYFQDSLLDKVAREVIPAPPERVRPEHVDFDRKDFL